MDNIGQLYAMAEAEEAGLRQLAKQQDEEYLALFHELREEGVPALLVHNHYRMRAHVEWYAAARRKINGRMYGLGRAVLKIAK